MALFWNIVSVSIRINPPGCLLPFFQKALNSFILFFNLERLTQEINGERMGMFWVFKIRGALNQGEDENINEMLFQMKQNQDRYEKGYRCMQKVK